MGRDNVQKVLVVAVVTLLVGLSPLAAATIVGQIGTNGTSLDGHRVPSGTTLLSDSVVATGDHSAIVNLINGQTVLLGGRSQVLFEIADAGLAIHVQAGTLAFRTGADQTVTLAKNSVLVLNNQGQVQEGTRVNRADVDVCDLRNADTGDYFTSPVAIAQCHAEPGEDECDWNKLEVSEAELQEYLDHGAVRLDDRPPDLNEGCGTKVGAWWKWPLVGVAAAGASYVVFDASDSDSESDSDSDTGSPVRP